jgi:nitroreductase
MAICPSGAIEIIGRTLSPDDIFDFSNQKKASTYEQLYFLLSRRRSIREFKKIPVGNDLTTKILDASRTAPMGLPPSDVNVLVFDSKEKVLAFSREFCAYLEDMKWFVSDWFLFLMRPFWGKANNELFRNFVKPLFHVYIENMHKGINLVTYDAPLAMYFYGSPYADPADPVIAATYAMITAETLGLGSCMLGGIHPLIQSGRRAKKFRMKQGIRYKSREGIFVIFGYPDVKYQKGIRRTFASIDYA